MDKTLDEQTAIALVALAAALCKQPSIDGQKLRIDFLDAIEGLEQGPGGVGIVGQQIAGLMDSMNRSKGPDIP